MKRRTFFSKIAGLVAAVAIAPEIAFRAKLPMPAVEKLPIFWMQETRFAYCVSEEYKEALNRVQSKNIYG